MGFGGIVGGCFGVMCIDVVDVWGFYFCIGKGCGYCLGYVVGWRCDDVGCVGVGCKVGKFDCGCCVLFVCMLFGF